MQRRRPDDSTSVPVPDHEVSTDRAPIDADTQVVEVEL